MCGPLVGFLELNCLCCVWLLVVRSTRSNCIVCYCLLSGAPTKRIIEQWSGPRCWEDASLINNPYARAWKQNHNYLMRTINKINHNSSERSSKRGNRTDWWSIRWSFCCLLFVLLLISLLSNNNESATFSRSKLMMPVLLPDQLAINWSFISCVIGAWCWPLNWNWTSGCATEHNKRWFSKSNQVSAIYYSK